MKRRRSTRSVSAAKLVDKSDLADSSALRYESAPARRKHILDLVNERGFCSAVELSHHLSVSEMTVRRDIRRMADEGLARAVHGGISATSNLLGPIDFQFRASQRLSEKQAIARLAVSMIKPDTVVAIDAGTTTLEAARLLPPDIRITVVTHSLPVIGSLASRSTIELIGLGGALHLETQAFAGPITLRALSDIRAHTLLLGATSVRDNAMWCTNTFDAATKRALIEAADHVVLLVDSEKFDLTAFMKVAELSAAHTVITDERISDRSKEMIASANVELLIASCSDKEVSIDAAKV